MHPLLLTFIKLTLAVTAALVALFVLLLILKVVLFAAVIAALVIGTLFVINLFRRPRSRLPVGRP
jgi:hypothetical protein